jgi:radical SAM superfamily enzyme YgiQ (UPF0313 family)
MSVHVVLISTYELGRQPFGLASPAAWLKADGHDVTCVDLAVDELPRGAISAADVIAFYVPMHTATRIATERFASIKSLNASARFCFYGLYAGLNQEYLRSLGDVTIISGEFEQGLVELCRPGPRSVPVVSLRRQTFLTPYREGLPSLRVYAHLTLSDDTTRMVGYTEASRGCKHRCRHCPIVTVYDGQFRIVAREVVLDDIRQQVEAGAEHITFGDPDFFNGPTHAMTIVRELHDRWPQLSYDVTIKVEHLLKRANDLEALRDTGCVLVTSAIESVDDTILNILDKGHTRADVYRLVRLLNDTRLALNPTFVAFTPWTSQAGYVDFLRVVAELDLIDNITPIQYAIRLLIPEGSHVLDIPGVHELVGPFDSRGLCYPWSHPDSTVDQLYADVLRAVKRCKAGVEQRRTLFSDVWTLATKSYDGTSRQSLEVLSFADRPARAAIPWLSEPWFC